MSTQIQVQKPAERAVEFQPFGAADKIKLSIRMVQDQIAVPTRSGKTCSERDALKFVMLCQAQRLNPWAGDAFLIGYDGQQGPTFSLITAHVAFLKRAETSPDFEGMESGVIIKDGDEIKEREGDFHLPDEHIVGGWARVFRKGRKPTYRRVRMERFNKGFAQWKEDAAGMIVKCAESDALRSTFPTLLGGLYTGGEILEVVTVPSQADGPSFGRPALVDSTPEQPKRLATRQKAPEQEAAPEPSQEAVEAPTKTDAEEIAAMMDEAGVPHGDCLSYLDTTGLLKDATSLASIAELPAEFATKLRADAKTLSKIVKIYGKKVVA